MRVRPVDSTSIARVGYDDASRTLEVHFVNGSRYRYFEVPRAVYERLLAAESKGRFVNAHVRLSYRYERF